MAYKRATGMEPQTCPECALSFIPHDARQLFCTRAHRREFENRLTAVMAPHAIEAMAWRAGRHKKGNPTARVAFVEFTLAIDKANADAKLAGRMSALEYLRLRYKRQGVHGVI